ncbi:HAD family hydrolase [Kitasatospora sp. NPDC127111]|uniref:HAD family hydrolase n=1 Tax=Kitasatospora sp. NPDC127111 TaxID=3345363 RepID=UPI003644B75D
MTVISAALFGTDWRGALPGSAPAAVSATAANAASAAASDTALLRECAARGWTVVLTGPGPVGAPALTVAAPGRDPVRAALDLVDGTPSHAVFVAGSVPEVLAARRAAVPCVALENGGATGPELRAAGAAEVHRDSDALLHVLDDSLLARPRAFGDCRPAVSAAPAGLGAAGPGPADPSASGPGRPGRSG